MNRRTMLLVVASALVLSACGTTPVQPTSYAGGITHEELKKIILLSLAERGWLLSDEKENLVAARHVRGSFIAAINITISKNHYTIEMDPVNTTLKSDEGRVHRRYNKWIRQLDADIQRRILKERTVEK